MKSIFIIVPSALILFMSGLITGKELSLKAKDLGQITGLNHVAIRVADFDKASDFYENTLGFPIAYRINDVNGNPILAYFQINKSTFIELLPVDSEHREGLDHFGLETNQIDSLITRFHNSGIDVTHSRVSPFTGVHISNSRDLNGIRFELIEAVEGSAMRRAIDNWEK